MSKVRRARKVYLPSRWDRFVAGVAPRYGLRRIQAKSAIRSYEAASTGRRTAGWRRSGGDANNTIRPALKALRELTRDLRRNNAWARRGIRVIGNNVVGRGIVAKAVTEDDKLRATATALFKTWGKKASCDYDGRMPFSGLQRLVMTTVVESGEAFVIRYAAKSSDNLSIPMRIRVLEPDYLDVDRQDTGVSTNGTRIIQGIELDASGRRLAYWMFETHPGAEGIQSTKSTRIPADEVLHVYDVERAGQIRGVPWLAAVIAKLNDLDEFEDAALMQQKIAALFGAFVTDLDSNAPALSKQDEDDAKLEEMEPGHIQYLTPGKTITFASPPPTADQQFTAGTLRRIAAGMGVTYEDLTGDYSQVNFSSARMGRISHWANVTDWRANMLIPQLLDGVWEWAMDIAVALGDIPEAPDAKWTPPPMPMLDPGKEAQAYNRLMRNGLMTWPDAVQERGGDPEQHIQEIAEWKKKLDDLGIILDSDPSKTSSSGGAQPDQSGDDAAKTEASTTDDDSVDSDDDE